MFDNSAAFETMVWKTPCSSCESSALPKWPKFRARREGADARLSLRMSYSTAPWKMKIVYFQSYMSLLHKDWDAVYPLQFCKGMMRCHYTPSRWKKTCQNKICSKYVVAEICRRHNLISKSTVCTGAGSWSFSNMLWKRDNDCHSSCTGHISRF